MEVINTSIASGASGFKVNWERRQLQARHAKIEFLVFSDYPGRGEKMHIQTSFQSRQLVIKMSNTRNNVIHERHTRSGKPNKDYIKGRFLGKVISWNFILFSPISVGRLCQMLWVHGYRVKPGLCSKGHSKVISEEKACQAKGTTPLPPTTTSF